MYKIMEKPTEYFAIHKETNETVYYNYEMLRPGRITQLGQWEYWIDTRYKAKLRLYHYITKTKPFKYEPYKDTEIGKSIPILNF